MTFLEVVLGLALLVFFVATVRFWFRMSMWLYYWRKRQQRLPALPPTPRQIIISVVLFMGAALIVGEIGCYFVCK